MRVDERRAVPDVTGHILERHGYHVAKAAGGAEALAIFAARKEDAERAVTDRVMSVMNGFALIRILRKMKPGLPIIASTYSAAMTEPGTSKRFRCSA